MPGIEAQLAAEAELRRRIDAMSTPDLALLVKVAAEAINDIPACREVADVVAMSREALSEWGERILYTDPAGGEDSLCVVSEMAMGWYQKVEQPSCNE